MNKNKIIILIVVAISIIGLFMYKRKNNEYDILLENNIYAFNQTESESSNQTSKIKVHIIGEINNPGLYELEEGARIYDLIILAGSQTENADLNKINLAYELSDGEKIYIPSIFDEDYEYINSDNNKSGKININKATENDLQNITGIGPGLAQKIVSYRNANGKFDSIDDLKNVSGIGEKKFESIKEFISVN